MRIPDKIVYGGMEFRVEFEEHPVIDGESVWGHWDYPNQRIILASQLAKPAMLATLFHEIAHIIMEMAGFSGLNEKEEWLADIFGYGFFQIMTQNQELCADGTRKDT
jgi:hypothetical protein